MPTPALFAVAALAGAAALADRTQDGSAARPALTPDSISVAHKSVAKIVKETLGISDVRVSPSGQALYLMGPARKLEASLGASIGPLLVRVLVGLGAPVSIARSYAEDAGHWEGLFSVVRLIADQLDVPEASELSVVVIPAPGGPQEAAWSAAKGRMVPAVRVPDFRFCDQPKVPLGRATGPASVTFPGITTAAPGAPAKAVKAAPPLPFFLSHGVTLDGLRKIVDCGGLLWPSLALTWRVPETYGDVVFLADVRVLPQIVKPTGRPRAMPYAYLAGTDIWSPDAGALESRQAEISKQLRGEELRRGLQSDLLYTRAMRADEDLVGVWGGFGGAEEAVERVETYKALVRTLQEILRVHGAEGGGVYTYPQHRRRPVDEAHRYPYAELKIVGIVNPADLVVCLHPRALAAEVHPLLDRIGFGGFRVPFDWGGGLRKDWSDGNRTGGAWASAATQALLRWRLDPTGVSGVRVGPLVRGDARQAEEQPYEPSVEWGPRSSLGSLMAGGYVSVDGSPFEGAAERGLGRSNESV